MANNMTQMNVREKQGVIEILKNYPLTEDERDLFVKSEKRINKVLGIEKFKDAQIEIEIVESNACIAGHAVGDKIYFDSMGRLLVSKADKPICSRLLHRIWLRVMLMMDRMADDSGDYIRDGKFAGELPDCRMNCYGDDFPYGDCGMVLTKVSVDTKGAK